MISEAKQETESKQQPVETRVTSRVQNLTDTASFNAFVTLTLTNGQEVSTQLTYRHGLEEDGFVSDFQKWYRILDKIAAEGDHVKFHNGSKPATPAAHANTDQPGQPEKPSTGSKRNYKDPLTEAEKPAELVDITENIYAAEFDLFKVLPQPDDKATVEFWKDGMDYAVGAKMNKWKHDTIKPHIARLTDQEIDPAKAAQYRIAGTVYWVLGNEFKYTKDGVEKTTRYKNLVLVKPAF